MSDLRPIVSLAGDDLLHARAGRYNERLGVLRQAQDDMEDAYAWNHRERFGSGMFSSTKPPVPTYDIAARIESLRAELARERSEIVSIAKGSVKP